MISTITAITAFVPMNAFVLRLVLIKKMLRSAPWFPDNPPKKPLMDPPKYKFLILYILCGNVSIVANNMRSSPIQMWSSEISPLTPRKEYSLIGVNSDRPLSNKAPGIDATKAVDPNLRAMFQLMAFQRIPVFKTL